MKKRCLAILLALCMALALLPVSAFAADSDFMVIMNGVLTKYNGGGGDVVIPDGVTSIGGSAFFGCTSLTSVTIPDSVTEIGYYAFSGCTGLTSVTIPSSVTSIGGGVFRDCTSLTSVTIPSSMTSIGVCAFQDCTSLTSVTIPDSVTEIGYYAFSGCTGLTSVTIPSSVTSIGGSAFQDCTSLTSVTIPSSVTSIGGSAFSGCTSLTAIQVDANNKHYASLDGVLFGNDIWRQGWNLVAYPGGKQGAYTIPSSVTSINNDAFFGCAGLTAIEVDANNKYYASLDGVLFGNYGSELKAYPGGKQGAYTIPSGVTSIGSDAFRGCTGLTSVTIPSGVTSIGLSAFQDCTGLVSVTIPSSVTSIENYAFRGCTGLTIVTIPNSVTSISIGEDAFPRSTPLLYSDKELDLNKEEFIIEDGILIRYNGLGSDITIPDSVTAIGDYAFYNCTSLEHVTGGSGLTHIGHCAFAGCTSLNDVVITSTQDMTVGAQLFYNCRELRTVTLPDSITFLDPDRKLTIEDVGYSYQSGRGNSMFQRCTELQRVVFTATGRPSESMKNLNYKVTFYEIPDEPFVVGLPNSEIYSDMGGNWKITAGLDPSKFILPQNERITALSNTICDGIADPYDKAKAIFTWMAQNIVYDYDYYNGKKDTVTILPDEVLDSRLTICDGYTRLTQALLQAQGIPAAYIGGSSWTGNRIRHPDGTITRKLEGHAWNAAYINGRWVYIDSTWGRPQVTNVKTGEVSAGFNPDEFDLSLCALSEKRFGEDYTADPYVRYTSTDLSRTVTPNRATVLVNGEKVAFEAYTVNGNNYFKLRDVAQALTGSGKQFEVTWDMEKSAINLISGQPYTTVGGELVPGDGTDKTADPNTPDIYLDGAQFFLGAYAINGNNYVKLRDLGLALDFNVSWDNANQTIVINTNESYTAD